MPKLPVFDMEGTKIEEIDVSDAVFAAKINPDLMHQAVVMYEANRRAGTSATKTRGMVRGGGRKPWRQKGLNRARHGSIRSPIWRKGGVVFGPQPRSFRQRMPKKMRRAALRSALSAKLRDGELKVLDTLALATPKAKDMRHILRNLELDGCKTLIVLSEPDLSIRLSVRNLPGVETIEARELNAREVLRFPKMLLTRAALRQVEEGLAG